MKGGGRWAPTAPPNVLSVAVPAIRMGDISVGRRPFSVAISPTDNLQWAGSPLTHFRENVAEKTLPVTSVRDVCMILGGDEGTD